MSWEAPAALWLGLTVPAVLLLWILRPKRPRVRVSSLMLWTLSPAVRQSAQPWQRLRNHPLLWVQIVAAALLALAAAKPFLAGAGENADIVVLLDASGSMRATDVEPDRFGAAQRAVLDVARGLAPGERLTVIRLDQEPRIIVAGARAESQVQAALRGEEAGYGPPNVASALALAAGVVQGPAQWVLLSDGGIVLPEESRIPPGTTVRFVEIGRAVGNVAVTSLSVREVGPNALAIQAALRNVGDGDVSGRLQLLADGALVGARDWSLAPRAEGYVTWTGLSSGPAWFEARLTGVPAEVNALAHDDEAWAALPRARESSALLVSSGNLFLERALTLDQRLRAFRAEPSDWQSLGSPGQYAVTVFDGIWPEAPPTGAALIVGPRVGSEFSPTQVQPVTSHPLMRHVDWSEVQVARARQVALDPTWETVIDSDRGPLLAIRSDGARREALLTFSLGQSDLPLRPAFPVLMTNLLEWLLPALDPAPQAVALGSPLSLDASPLSEQVWVELPDGGREELAPPWPPRPFYSPRPGVYRVVQATPGGAQELLVTTNGYHPLEADLTPRRPSLPSAEIDARAGFQAAMTFWPFLAMAVLGLSFVEWWIDARGR